MKLDNIYTIGELKSLKNGDEVIYYFHDKHGDHFGENGEKMKVANNSLHVKVEIGNDRATELPTLDLEDGYDFDYMNFLPCHKYNFDENLPAYYDDEDQKCGIYKISKK